MADIYLAVNYSYGVAAELFSGWRWRSPQLEETPRLAPEEALPGSGDCPSSRASYPARHPGVTLSRATRKLLEAMRGGAQRRGVSGLVRRPRVGPDGEAGLGGRYSPASLTERGSSPPSARRHAPPLLAVQLSVLQTARRRPLPRAYFRSRPTPLHAYWSLDRPPTNPLPRAP